MKCIVEPEEQRALYSKMIKEGHTPKEAINAVIRLIRQRYEAEEISLSTKHIISKS
jgi:hypothetical protein